jgi:hypothetical protein
LLLLLSDESGEQERHINIASRTKNYRAYAKLQLSDTQWKCLDELWERESSWATSKKPHLAQNPNSSAYGIPQATKGKMIEAGADWKTNPITQVRWGLKYIKIRYKTPCAALEHHNKKNWY